MMKGEGFKRKNRKKGENKRKVGGEGVERRRKMNLKLDF